MELREEIKIFQHRDCRKCPYWKTCERTDPKNMGEEWVELFCSYDIDTILSLIKAHLPELAKEAGYVKLAKEQTLPQVPSGVGYCPLTYGGWHLCSGSRDKPHSQITLKNSELCRICWPVNRQNFFEDSFRTSEVKAREKALGRIVRNKLES